MSHIVTKSELLELANRLAEVALENEDSLAYAIRLIFADFDEDHAENIRQIRLALQNYKRALAEYGLTMY